MFETNQYFDGKVQSIAFQTKTLPATVGVMDIGEYEFGTSQHETMTVVSGSLEITLKDESASKTYQAGESFEVAANSSFNVKVVEQTAYLCTYA